MELFLFPFASPCIIIRFK